MAKIHKRGKIIFMHHYPQGEGADNELMKKVERDMEKNHNDKFEDIVEIEMVKKY